MNEDELLEQEVARQDLEGTPQGPDPVAPAPAPVEDPRLTAALEQQRQQRQKADLLRAFQQILQASAPNSGFKADYSMANALEKRADEPLEQYKAKLGQEAAAKKEGREQQEHESKMMESKLRQDDFQMKLEKSKLDFQDMQANRDPGSPQSKIAQDRVMEMQKKLGQPVNEQQVRSMSGAQLYNMFEYLKEDLVQHYKNENSRLERQSRETIASEATKRQEATNQMYRQRWEEGEKRRLEDQKLREEKDTRSQKRDLSKDITARVDKLKGNKTYQELEKQGLSFDQADELMSEIDKGNEVAMGALGTKMARAMGEVGVLTESDVKRYIEAQSLVQKMKDKFGRAFMGHVSQQTLQDIKEVNAKMRQGFAKKKGELVSEYVDQTYENFGKDAGLSRDEIMVRMGLGKAKSAGTPQPAAGPYGETTVREGKTYKWNPTAGKYQLLGE